MASIDDRNQRLDALLAATESWASKRTKELQDSVALAKKILKGRTGSERLVAATTQAATKHLIDEIEEFISPR